MPSKLCPDMSIDSIARNRIPQCLILLYSALSVAVAYQVVPNADCFLRGEGSHRVEGAFKDPSVFGPYAAVGCLMFLWMYSLTQYAVA